MKKILLTSTALCAMAGAAAAEVSLSGGAEMGIADTNAADVGVQFHQDLDVTFTMSGETDSGLSFGASIDLDEVADDDEADTATGNDADDGGATIFISGSFGTVTMGDTDGALDWALTEAGNMGNPGSIRDDETAHAGYNGSYLDGSGDGQILRWDYSSGAFGVAISYEQGDTDLDGPGVVGEGDGFALGFKYTVELGGADIDLGLGYQDFDGSDVIGVSAVASFSAGFTAGIVYSDWDVAGVADEHLGIGLGYETGAFSVHANYGEFDSGADGYGLAAAYDLGGGASVHLGYGSGSDDVDTYSLGLAMSF